MEFQQNTLFGNKIIKSIRYDETEIIHDILFLHARGKMIDCDPCYSTGNFYKGYAIKPRYKFDKFPQTQGVIKATADNLPLPNESVEVIMFDPPFLIGGDPESINNQKDGSCIIAKRFTNFKCLEELKKMYSSSLTEFYRVLVGGGIVIFKCQDTVSGGLNIFTHVWIMNKAFKIGFYPKDLFILLAKNRLTDNRKQQHARKFHSYFWVFKKDSRRIDYSL